MRIFAALTLVLVPFFSNGQTLTWGGNIDLEYRQGGDDSRAGLNWTPTPKPSIYTPFVRLWASVDFSEKLWANVTLQSDYYEGPKPSPVFISLANVNYMPFENSNFTITAGKFVIPYGLEENRFLNIDNPFTNYSLLHQWNLHLSKDSGYFGIAVPSGYAGMAVVYGRRYTQGILFQGSFGEADMFSYKFAATTASVSSFFPYGKNDAPSFIGRVTFQPKMWIKIGASGSFGEYMDGMARSSNNGNNQRAFSSDVSVNHGYFELNFQYTFSDWDTYIDGTYSPTAPTSSTFYRVSTSHFMGEFIVNIPKLPGTWIATRYEVMRFSDHNFVNGYSGTWMRNLERYEITLGKKLTRNAHFKAGFMDGNNAGPIQWSDWVSTAQITLLF